MALAPTDLIALRDELIKARAKGIKSLRLSNGESVEYKTDAEQAAAINDLEARIQRASATRPAVVRFSSSKGF